MPIRRTARRASGFDDAFDELAGLAYRVAFRILGRRADAEDVAQEAVARVYVRWGSVHGHAEAWVVRVATNLALDVHRRDRRERRPPDRAAAVSAGAAAVAGAGPTVDRLDLIRLLESLPRRQREVLVLRFVADLPERETAALLGCSVGTVKTHAHRALAALRVSWPDLVVEPHPEPGGC
ncbi:MAG: putative polymerase subfamily sigma factor [Acidimicrobiales bacterium]|nr:putative polymerase subfamily sigma factor [Acidimicrobiales bacterium]